MVAQEYPDLAAVVGGLVLEPHQEVHDLAHPGAPVGDIAGLHQDRGPAAPPAFAVDEAGLLQDRAQPGAGAVDVADGYHAAGIGLDRGRGGRGAGREQRQDGHPARGAAETRAPVGGRRRRRRGPVEELHLASSV